MNSGDIIFNQENILTELRSIKRKGIDTMVSMLSESDFFTTRLDNSDPGEGSLANYCLWVLRLCRETFDYAKGIGKGSSLDPESLVIVSILHKLYDCNLKKHGSQETTPEGKTMAIVKKSGLELLACESDVLSGTPIQGASIESRNPSGLLSYILEGAKKNALDYASGIPFSETPLDATLPKPINKTSFVFLDEDDHRLWCNLSNPGYKSNEHPELKDFYRVETTAMLPLIIGADSTEAECMVYCDESGVMGFLSGYTREDDGTLFMCSDRLCFGYSDMVFFLSRYPHYRPSYVLGQRTDGKWGAFSIKASGKKRPPVVDVVPLVRHEFRNRDAAIRAMKNRAGYPARVKHHLFYNEIQVMDCFLADL